MPILNIGPLGYAIAGLYCFLIAGVIYYNACLEIELHSARKKGL